MKQRATHERKSRIVTASTAAVSAPVLRFRQLFIGILCVVILIIWPMFMVWKQIYITNVSIRESALSDSLIVLTKEAATLRLYNEKLCSTQRIESIARKAIGLEYPTSEQIVLIRESKRGGQGATGGSGFLALLLRTFSRARG